MRELSADGETPAFSDFSPEGNKPMSYLSKLIEEEIDKLNGLAGEDHKEQVQKCLRLVLDYFKYHEEGKSGI